MVVALAGGLVLALRPLVLAGGDPAVVPGQSTTGVAVANRVYVVQSGDTLWSIARRLHPGEDPRPVMDQLATQVPGGVLRAGDRLVLP
jgi:spore germination protein YaaH